MRTRLAGFVFVLVFIMAMTYSGFMVWAQETTGQTAELPARPWWHCDYHADVPPWSIYVPCTEARKRTATAVAIAMAYETRVVTPTVQHIATLVALGTPNAEAIATYRVPIGYERATKEALSVECRRQFPPLTRRNRDRFNSCLNSRTSTWSRLASLSRPKVLALIRIQQTRETEIIESTANLEALVPRLAAYPGTATAIATEWLGKVLLTPTHTPTATPIPWWQCDYHAEYPPLDNPTLVYVHCGGTWGAVPTATAIAEQLAYISRDLRHTTATAEAHETQITRAVAAATDAPWWSVRGGNKTATTAVRKIEDRRFLATHAATRNLGRVTQLQYAAAQYNSRSTRAAYHYYGKIHRTATALSWTATPTPRPTPTYTVTPTFTATPTPSPTPTSTATLPYTVTPTFTATPTATATPAPATPTSTATPKLTPTQPGVCVSEPCSPSSNPAPAPQRPPGGGSGGGGSSSPAPAPTPTVPPTATATPIATPLPTETPCGGDPSGNHPCGPLGPVGPQSPLPTPTPKHKLYFPFQDK